MKYLIAAAAAFFFLSKPASSSTSGSAGAQSGAAPMSTLPDDFSVSPVTIPGFSGDVVLYPARRSTTWQAY